MALYAAKRRSAPEWADVQAGEVDWIGVDEGLPEHASVLWRKRNFPKVLPRYTVSSVLSVLELTALGLGVGILPTFLAARRSDIVSLTGALEGAETELWQIGRAHV